MRMLPVVGIVAAIGFVSYVSAQDKPVVVGKPPYTAEAVRKRVSGEIPRTCVLADKTEHLVGTTVATTGKRYRCVTVFNENFAPVGAAWTAVE